MTHTEEQQDRMIRRLSPDLRIPPSVAQSTGPGADELRRLIMGSAPARPQPAAAPARGGWRSWSLRRRLAYATPIVGGLAGATFAVVAVLPGAPAGPTPARADALSFTARGGYLDIRIVDPAADPQRYNAELAAHGLKINLSLAPAPADEVGRVVNSEENDAGGPGIQTLEAPGNCTANGDCSVGLRVPLRYQGQARFVFGRTTKPGEQTPGDAPVLSAEQSAQLKSLHGKRVSEVRAFLAAHGETASYRISSPAHRVGPGLVAHTREATAGEVPGDWYVYDTAPLPSRVVALWVSKDGKAPAPEPTKS